jgi:transposase
VARVINKVVNLLDIWELTSQEKIEGRPTYHSWLMLGMAAKLRTEEGKGISGILIVEA